MLHSFLVNLLTVYKKIKLKLNESTTTTTTKKIENRNKSKTKQQQQQQILVSRIFDTSYTISQKQGKQSITVGHAHIDHGNNKVIWNIVRQPWI